MAQKKRNLLNLTGKTDLARSNNARYVLDEFTSSRRVATLARIPEQAEILSAIDTYRNLRGSSEAVVTDVLDRMRSLFAAWTPGEDVPAEILDVVREFQASTEALEPPAGWDAFDGYPETWGQGPPRMARHPRVTKMELAPDAEATAKPIVGEEASEKAARLAQAFVGLLNLAGVLASPRLWVKASQWPTRAHLVEHADALLSLLAETSGQTTLAAPAQRLRAQLAAWEPGPEVPPDVQHAARELLAAVGVGEPPDGWAAFEGGN